jgi:hypothetical protein
VAAWFLGCLGFIIAIPIGLVGLILGIIGAVGKGGGKLISVLGIVLSVGAMGLSVYWWWFAAKEAGGAIAGGLTEALKVAYQKVQKEAEDAPKATVSELVKAFKDDAAKAKEKYHGLVRVTGKLADIKAPSGKLADLMLSAHLKGEGMDSMSVEFLPGAADTLKAKSAGDEVTLAGHLNQAGGKLDLTQAVFMP